MIPAQCNAEWTIPASKVEMQDGFAVEYAMNGGDAWKAAVAAGYAERSAVDLGPRCRKGGTDQLPTSRRARTHPEYPPVHRGRIGPEVDCD